MASNAGALTPGQPAPDITLQDQTGETWKLSDHRGTPVVVYFYPKDDTPGCTNQACDIRDHWDEFSQLGVPVIGISPDDVPSHAKFAEKYQLPHTLLADPEKEVIAAYGAWGERSVFGKNVTGVIRSSVVIDGDGNVAQVFAKIKPKDQSEKSLATVRELVS